MHCATVYLQSASPLGLIRRIPCLLSRSRRKGKEHYLFYTCLRLRHPHCFVTVAHQGEKPPHPLHQHPSLGRAQLFNDASDLIWSEDRHR